MSMHGIVEGAADHSDLALEAAKAKRKVCEADVETRVPLSLHPRILSLFTHQPTLILRISIAHTRTYLFFTEIGLARDPCAVARLACPSIHLSMSHWRLLVRFHILYPFV
jgi:hypothetical protein